MNFDLAFFSAVIRQSAVPRMVEEGISERLFSSQQYKTWWLFLLNHYRKYGETISEDVFKQKFPEVELIDDELPKLSFIVDSLRERRVYNELSDGVKKAAKLLTDKKTGNAFEALKDSLRTLEDDTKPTHDYDWSQTGDQRWSKYLARKAVGGIDGIPLPFQSFNEELLGFHPGELVVIVARQGTGKCILEGSKVHLADGRFTPIEDITSTDVAVSFDERECALRPTKIRAKIDSGVKSAYKVRLASGRFVGVTEEHPFLTVEG